MNNKFLISDFFFSFQVSFKQRMMNPVETWELYTMKYERRKGSLSSPMKAKLFLLIHMEKIRPNYTLWFGTEVASSPRVFSFSLQIHCYGHWSPQSFVTSKAVPREMDLGRGVSIADEWVEIGFPICRLWGRRSPRGQGSTKLDSQWGQSQHSFGPTGICALVLALSLASGNPPKLGSFCNFTNCLFHLGFRVMIINPLF